MMIREAEKSLGQSIEIAYCLCESSFVVDIVSTDLSWQPQ